MASEAVSEGPGGHLFTRNATGLVRSVSPTSTLIFNTFTAPAAFVLAIALFWTLGAFPGANIYVALIVGYLMGVVFCFAIGTVTSAIPRSGGDYVFVGRILHPIFGIVSSFCFTAGVLLSAAGIALFMVTSALAPSLSAVGVVSHSPTVLNWGTTLGSSKGWQFTFGIIFIALAALLAASGWKWSLRVQNAGFVVTSLGLLVTAIVVLTKSGSVLEIPDARTQATEAQLALEIPVLAPSSDGPDAAAEPGAATDLREPGAAAPSLVH